MLTAVRNKQKLKYSLYLDREPIYELDEDGNKIVEFVDEEGNIYYKETGSYMSAWSEPVEFFANISQSGGEAEAREYGLSNEDFDAVMVSVKGYVPLVIGSLIWHNSEVLYEDEENTDVDEKSADYKVLRVLESLNMTKYLLKSVAK